MYLLTGASGFLGSHIMAHLNKPVLSLGRSSSNHILADLATGIPSIPAVDTIIHVAGLAHSSSLLPQEEQLFYQINHSGTLNLLTALSANPPQRFIFISTVSVYGLETGINIDENHPLQGQKAYARSKILAEAAVRQWCAEKAVMCFILRLPLIVGKSPPGNLGAISNLIRRGYYFPIANNYARRSVVLAEDVATFIPSLNRNPGTYNLTDGVHPYFSDIERAIASIYNRSLPVSLPHSFFRMSAKAGDLLNQLGIQFPLSTFQLKKMTSTLTFTDIHARRMLNWSPRPVLKNVQSIL